MKVKLLYDLKKEMDRIYIKGIRTARNNARLLKTFPILEKYRDEDTAYNELLYALKNLVAYNSYDYTESLATIHTSLNYLLRFYGQAIEPNEERTEQVPVYHINEISTSHSYSKMKPLIQVLSGGGKNRLEVLRKAQEDNLFSDFRTYPFLDKALGDRDSEVVCFVENIIRNVVGDKMLPFIVNGFEINDKGENLRRLDILYDFHYEGMNELIDEILDGTATLLQAKVIDYISNDAKYEDRVLALADNQQKTLREIAYRGLINLKSEKAERKLIEVYSKSLKKKNKGELDVITDVLSLAELQYTFDDVFALIKENFNILLAANKRADIDLFYNLRMSIHILRGKVKAEVLLFFETILFHEEYNEIIRKKQNVLEKAAVALSNSIISVIQDLDPEEIISFCEKVIRHMPESKWKLPFYKLYMTACIQKGDSAAFIYDTFAPYYDKGAITIDDLMQLFGSEANNIDSPADLRWVDRLYEAMDHLDMQENVDILLMMLHRLDVNHERYNERLIHAGKSTRKYLLEVTNMIMSRDLPEKYEIVYQLVKHCHDQGASCSNALRQLSRATYWKEYPKEYVDRFKQMKNLPRAIYSKIEGK